MQEIIIIPDVHGRNFWRTAAGLVKKHHLVFLGDYLDPYPGEGISSYTAYEELEEIVILKEKYPGNVTLLLGNHDLHYLAPKPGGCRFDWSNAYKNRSFFYGSLSLFDIAFFLQGGDRDYLFTHAGLLKGWVDKHEAFIGATYVANVVNEINSALHSPRYCEMIIAALSETSPTRGGTELFASPTWADTFDHRIDCFEFDGVYQIFGHTLRKEARITPFWACLDCRQLFKLNTKTGKIEELTC